MPPPFAFNNAVLAETYKRIVENTKCITCRVWETGATGAPRQPGPPNPPDSRSFGSGRIISSEIVFAISQIATTAISRPEAPASRFMSSGSPVRIVAFCPRAVVTAKTSTTTASTTPVVLVRPSRRPASCASVSPRGNTTHPVRKRRSWACFGERLTEPLPAREPAELRQIPDGLVFSPRPALVSVGCNKNGSVAGLALIR